VTPTQPFIRASVDDSIIDFTNHAIDADIDELVEIVAGAENIRITIKDCTHGSTTLLTGSIPDRDSFLRIINSHTSNSITQQDEYQYAGAIHTDTAVYVTADGDKEANDYSFKMVSNANADVGREPLRFLIASGYIDTATAKTITTPILHDSVTALTDAEFWTEVVHQDDTTTQGLKEDDHAADIFTGTNLTADTNGKWTESLTNDNEQKSVVTTALTGKPGYFEVYACLAKTSYTVYVGVPVIT